EEKESVREALAPLPKIPESRVFEEEQKFWVHTLVDILIKKSGEKSPDTVRSPYPKKVLYQMLCDAWYANALDNHIRAQPELVSMARAAKCPTKQQKNILRLLDWKIKE